MLIPLGILAASGGGAAGAYELISTTVLGAATSSVTFSSIVSTYKHLQIRTTYRRADAGTMLAMLTFNGDTGSNYSWHRLYGQGAAVYSDSSTSTTQILTHSGPSSSDTAGIFMPSVYDVLDYASTTKNKTVRAVTGAEMSSTADVIGLTSGLWVNTSAVTSLTLASLVGNFATGSRFSLYGIKGA